jgi:hypothetical protein
MCSLTLLSSPTTQIFRIHPLAQLRVQQQAVAAVKLLQKQVTAQVWLLV